VFRGGNANLHLSKPNTVISEVPEDYLNIYANAKATHSDRVHACVASLVYGTPARLYARAALFDRVGLAAITEQLVELDFAKLEEAKEDQVAFLRKALTT